eukprot:4248578-Pleurochrysis_carterae.AAC.2
MPLWSAVCWLCTPTACGSLPRALPAAGVAVAPRERKACNSTNSGNSNDCIGISLNGVSGILPNRRLIRLPTHHSNPSPTVTLRRVRADGPPRRGGCCPEAAQAAESWWGRAPIARLRARGGAGAGAGARGDIRAETSEGAGAGASADAGADGGAGPGAEDVHLRADEPDPVARSSSWSSSSSMVSSKNASSPSTAVRRQSLGCAVGNRDGCTSARACGSSNMLLGTPSEWESEAFPVFWQRGSSNEYPAPSRNASVPG